MEKGVYVRKLFSDKPVFVCFGNSNRQAKGGDYFRKGYYPCLKSLLRLEGVVARWAEEGKGYLNPSVDPIGWAFYWGEKKEPRKATEKPSPGVVLANIMSDLDRLAIELRNSIDRKEDDLGKSLQAAYTLLAGILKTACNLPS